jgi:PKD repeat protein
LIGYLNYPGTGITENCFWNTETTGQAASRCDEVGKTTAELQTLATFNEWNIATVENYNGETWFLVEGEDYPRLAWEGLPDATEPTPTPVSAAFTASPLTGTAPLAVQFTDTSTGSPTSWFWAFGDGGTSLATNPSHTYTVAGTYPVALTVSRAGYSDTATKTGYITVSAAPATPPPAPTSVASQPAFPYSEQRKDTMGFLLMCWGALPFVGVFCVVIFLVMNGGQRGSGGI